MSNFHPNRFSPFIMALCVVVGLVIGTFYANKFSGNRLNIINSGSSRLNNLLHIIDDQYVDTVDIDELVEKAMPQILSELDPHSVYVSAKDVQTANDDLKGSFSGVGIEFTIRQDTIHVENVIKDGPSEKAGLLAGDKIVSIDGKPFVGKVVTEEEAKHRLKGPKDTKVKIGVLRYGENKPKEFTVTRGDITMHSVSATYMLNDSTGYIRIKNFGEMTYAEMVGALANLSVEGFKNLVIDLRDNNGGYLEAATQMANEFLPKDRLIVYTQGRKSPRMNYKSDGRGVFQKLPIVVLINEGSASAAEIFAGAIQDNDRGMVIGRRSFGKGLVQKQIEFPDGSMIRLTVARYYTPSGRCIQKPYVLGDGADYEHDLLSRYQHGEYFSQDSIKHTGPKYYTSLGRVVYGGGGITPDKDTINFLRHNCRTYIFSASNTPAATAAALEALHIIQNEPERFENLWDVTNYALKRFREEGFEIGETESPIIPLYVRDAEKTFVVTKMAYDAGVFINPVIPPACAPQDTLVRFALMATHTREQVEQAVQILKKIFVEEGIIK